MKYINISVIIILLVCFFSIENINAQSKVGTIDIGAVISSLPESKKVDETLKNLTKNLNNRIVAKEKTFQQEIKKYNNEYSNLTPKQRIDYEKKLAGMEGDLEKMQIEAEEQVSKKQEELLKPLVEKVKKTVESVAKSKGYTHVLNKESKGFSEVVYALPSTNITPLVKARLGLK